MNNSGVDNVTIRKRRASGLRTKHNSLSDNSDSDLSTKSILSLPDLTTHNYPEIYELEAIISRLQEELKIAHEEVEKLNLELLELKKKFRECENKIKLFKTVGIDDISQNNSYNSTPLFCSKKNGKQNRRRSLNTRTKILERIEIDRKSTSPETSYERNVYQANQKNSDSQSNTNDVPTDGATHLQSENTHRIFIIGDGQLSGLAPALLSSGKGKWNNRYLPYGLIKPNANSSKVLECNDDVFGAASKDDIVLLCTGSEDTNPFNVIINLSIALDKLSHVSNVYVLPVLYNPYLNERKLNSSIKLVTRNFPKCKYLEFSNSYTTKSAYLNAVCNKINSYINFIEFGAQLLQSGRINKNRNNIVQPRKGTIPYYFKKCNDTSNPILLNTQMSNNKWGNINSSKKLQYNSNSNNNSFFRV